MPHQCHQYPKAGKLAISDDAIPARIPLGMSPLVYRTGMMRLNKLNLPITIYQMAPSKQGAGGGSATHKEPT